jgi:hypothetical protein
MRALLVLVLLLWGCASSPPVSLDHYRGVYTTHFDGIPDQSRICAVITNRGAVPLQWVRLRLRAYSQVGKRRSSWRSNWLYPRPIEVGETVALELVDPPVVDEFELKVVRSGRSPAARPGRPLRRSADCSESALTAALEDEFESRVAPGVEIRPMARAGDPTSQVLVAAGD